jgi:hypothetical protein
MACGPDAREVDGAIASVVAAASKHDATRLFEAIDQRARFAMGGLVKARQKAAEVIRAHYPKEAQAQALADLGDAARVDSAAALFALRCNPACMDALAAKMASPKEVREEGDLAWVTTVRGEQLELFRGNDGRYGIVWNTESLKRESTRAYAELDLIEKNAELYQKQRALK